MKVKIILLPVICLIIAVSCNHNGGESSLQRTDRTVIYEVNLSLNPELPNWMRNLDTRKYFSELTDKIKAGIITAYYPYTEHPEPLTWEQVSRSLGARSDTSFVMDEKTGKMNKKVTDQTFNLSELDRIIFIEEWTNDPNSMIIQKKVLGLAPVREFVKNDSGPKAKSIPFVIYFTEKKPSIMEY